MPSPPVIDIRFSLVGPGVVGRSLAHWLVARGARLRQVGTRRLEAVETLAHELNAVPVDLGALATDGEDLLLLTVSDEALPVGRRLAGATLPGSGGAPRIRRPRRRRAGASAAAPDPESVPSIPCRAFPRVSTDPGDADGTVFTIDGDAAAGGTGDATGADARRLGDRDRRSDSPALPPGRLVGSRRRRDAALGCR